MRAGDGLRATVPSTRSLPPITIDHVLARHDPRAALTSHAVAGSDHRAPIAELVLPAE
ncbi:MAG: hypothetical protein AVDCRST_MAG67-4115 [uncultured Solirubrobacteraceae bacterium]|uniref:Endonuclease/exonuclease/phosphatase n=1 Tax=uncultured Solirubrobacteraceae bacterium TaxID=1162706 RepID=A0A6J4TTK3_9ACTN|nr:MAG: hypothetical protein AVDCRST_MAG67-4115 [uncultured Solirubrobacteraceae bacterium]